MYYGEKYNYLSENQLNKYTTNYRTSKMSGWMIRWNFQNVAKENLPKKKDQQQLSLDYSSH